MGLHQFQAEPGGRRPGSRGPLLRTLLGFVPVEAGHRRLSLSLAHSSDVKEQNFRTILTLWDLDLFFKLSSLLFYFGVINSFLSRVLLLIQRPLGVGVTLSPEKARGFSPLRGLECSFVLRV